MIIKYTRAVIQFLSGIIISLIIASKGICNYWIIPLVVIYLITEVLNFNIFEKYKRLLAQLQLLYKICQFKPTDNVRCTYHVPCFRRWFFQIFGYIPFNLGGGRFFLKHKGIIGKSFMNYESRTVNFKDVNEYRKRMIEEFGYSEEEIKKRRDDRRSYLCHPLIDEKNKLHGLIYFDSSTPFLFPDIEDKEVKKLVSHLDFIKDSISGTF